MVPCVSVGWESGPLIGAQTRTRGRTGIDKERERRRKRQEEGRDKEKWTKRKEKKREGERDKEKNKERERKRGVAAFLFISSQTGARKFVAVSVSPQLFFLCEKETSLVMQASILARGVVRKTVVIKVHKAS